MADELSTEALDIIVSAMDKNPGSYDVRIIPFSSPIEQII
jgi:hypothetical protein